MFGITYVQAVNKNQQVLGNQHDIELSNQSTQKTNNSVISEGKPPSVPAPRVIAASLSEAAMDDPYYWITISGTTKYVGDRMLNQLRFSSPITQPSIYYNIPTGGSGTERIVLNKDGVLVGEVTRRTVSKRLAFLSMGNNQFLTIQEAVKKVNDSITLTEKYQIVVGNTANTIIQVGKGVYNGVNQALNDNDIHLPKLPEIPWGLIIAGGVGIAALAVNNLTK